MFVQAVGHDDGDNEGRSLLPLSPDPPSSFSEVIEQRQDKKRQIELRAKSLAASLGKEMAVEGASPPRRRGQRNEKLLLRKLEKKATELKVSMYILRCSLLYILLS